MQSCFLSYRLYWNLSVIYFYLSSFSWPKSALVFVQIAFRCKQAALIHRIKVNGSEKKLQTVERFNMSFCHTSYTEKNALCRQGRRFQLEYICLNIFAACQEKKKRIFFCPCGAKNK